MVQSPFFLTLSCVEKLVPFKKMSTNYCFAFFESKKCQFYDQTNTCMTQNYTIKRYLNINCFSFNKLLQKLEKVSCGSPGYLWTGLTRQYVQVHCSPYCDVKIQTFLIIRLSIAAHTVRNLHKLQIDNMCTHILQVTGMAAQTVVIICIKLENNLH